MVFEAGTRSSCFGRYHVHFRHLEIILWWPETVCVFVLILNSPTSLPCPVKQKKNCTGKHNRLHFPRIECALLSGNSLSWVYYYFHSSDQWSCKFLLPPLVCVWEFRAHARWLTGPGTEVLYPQSRHSRDSSRANFRSIAFPTRLNLKQALFYDEKACSPCTISPPPFCWGC